MWALKEFDLMIAMILSVSSSKIEQRTSSGLFYITFDKARAPPAYTVLLGLLSNNDIGSFTKLSSSSLFSSWSSTLLMMK